MNIMLLLLVFDFFPYVGCLVLLIINFFFLFNSSFNLKEYVCKLPFLSLRSEEGCKVFIVPVLSFFFFIDISR